MRIEVNKEMAINIYKAGCPETIIVKVLQKVSDAMVRFISLSWNCRLHRIIVSLSRDVKCWSGESIREIIFVIL